MDLNHVIISVLAVPFLCAVLLWILKRWYGTKLTTVKQVPGMKPSDPINGNKGDIDASESFHAFLAELHKEFGPIASFWMGKEWTVSIASPKLFRQHETQFDRPPQLFKKYEHAFGPKSVQFANKEQGRRQRLPFDRAYGHQAIAAYYPSFNNVIGQVVEEWSSRASGEHIGLMKEILAMSIDAFVQATFGDYFKDKFEFEKVDKCFKLILRTAEQSADGALPEPGTKERVEYDEAESELNEVVAKMVAHRRATRSLSGKKIFIDELLDTDVPEDELHSDALINFVAGFSNTAILIVFAIYHMGKHKDMQEKAYKEICEVVGEDDIDPYAYGQLKYIRQIIDETLRKNVLVSWAARFDQDRDTELGGYAIKRNTPVIHALGVVLQDENIWPHPERFDPDRFSTDRSRGRPVLAKSPFGFAGGRMCPGWRFALIEAVTALAIILRRLKITTVTQSVKRVRGLNMVPDREIYVTVDKR